MRPVFVAAHNPQQHVGGAVMAGVARCLYSVWLVACGLAWVGGAWADVWVSNARDNSVVQLDAEGNFVRRLAVCQRPRHMVWLNPGKALLVACSDSHQLALIDVDRWALTDVVPTQPGPDGFAVSPDGTTAYVSVQDDSALLAYDLASKTQRFATTVGAEPEGVLVGADGARVYVVSEVANTLYCLDARSGVVLWQAAVGARPRRLAMSPPGTELWVSNELGASLSVVDIASGASIATLNFVVPGVTLAEVKPVGMAMSSDGRTLWVALGRANRVAEVDVASRSVRGYVVVGKRPWGIAVSRDGRRLYVANGLSDDLTVVDTGTRAVLNTVPVGLQPHTVLVD